MGVGAKVADCIMLFSMSKHSAFPVDVWIKRAMIHFYLAPDVSLNKIRVFGREKFGELAGLAQQYLFYYARENNIPFLGICLGMQCAVIEYARNVLGLEGAHSSELNPETPFPVIDLMPEQKDVEDLGGTMRLGLYPCKLEDNTFCKDVYASDLIYERHRHRYEFNNEYRTQLIESGLTIAGTSPDGRLVECVEVKDHPWFVAVQYHPELKSRPNRPHPLFVGFVGAALNNK